MSINGYAPLADSFIFLGEEQIDHDFVLMEGSNGASESVVTHIESHSIYTQLSSKEKGQNIFGKIFSILQTAKFLTAHPISSNEDPALERLNHLGQSLSSNILNLFFEALQQKANFKLIPDYYLTSGCEITTYSLEEIKQNLDQSKLEESIAQNEPIVIPVVLKGKELFNINHIALIIINNSSIEYFDSKGLSSKTKGLNDGSNTVFHVLTYLNQKLFNNEAKIFENPHAIQFDVNNCGVMVAAQVYRRIVDKQPMGFFTQAVYTESQIRDFRAYMFHQIEGQ